MTPDDVRPRPSNWSRSTSISPRSSARTAKIHAYDYIEGLMVCPERKTSSRSRCTSATATFWPAEVPRCWPLVA